MIEEEREKYRPFQHSDWRAGVEEFLINAGTNGRKHSDILHRFQLAADAPTITNHLEALLAERKVDRFRLKTKGRPAMYWRATTKIMEK